MAEPALFITWTTYGTWLRGDARGWTESKSGRTVRKGPDPRLELEDRNRMRHPPVLFDGPMRSCVESAIREVCVQKGWQLGALAVRTNHVHAVLRAGGQPERLLAALKARATRRLRENGLIEPDRAVWTTHGSTRKLFTDASIMAARDYIERFQDDRAGRFSGRRPE